MKITSNCQSISCTWKKINGNTKKWVLKRVFELLENVKAVVVGYEKSKKGYEHFHVYIEFKKKQIVKWSRLDEIIGKHGYYRPITKTPERVIAYVIKDGDFICKNIMDKNKLDYRIRCIQWSNMYKISMKQRKEAKWRNDISQMVRRMIKRKRQLELSNKNDVIEIINKNN